MKLLVDIPNSLNRELKMFRIRHNLQNLQQAVILCCEAYLNVTRDNSIETERRDK